MSSSSPSPSDEEAPSPPFGGCGGGGAPSPPNLLDGGADGNEQKLKKTRVTFQLGGGGGGASRSPSPSRGNHRRRSFAGGAGEASASVASSSSSAAASMHPLEDILDSSEGEGEREDEVEEEEEEEEEEAEEGGGAGAEGRKRMAREREMSIHEFAEERERRMSKAAWLGASSAPDETLKRVLRTDSKKAPYKKRNKYRRLAGTLAHVNRYILSAWNLIKWRCPYITFFPFIPLCACILFFIALAILFLLAEPSAEFWNVETYWWCFWVAYTIASFALIQFIMELLKKLVKFLVVTFVPWSPLYTYIKSTFYHIGGLLWAVLHLTTMEVKEGVFINGVAGDGLYWVENTITCLLIIFACKIVLVLTVRHIVSKLNRAQFWESIQEYLFKEKVLCQIISEKKRIKLMEKERETVEVNSPRKLSSSGVNHTQFAKAWNYVMKASHTHREQTEELQASLGLSKHLADTIPKEQVEMISNAIFDGLDHNKKGYFELKDVEILYGPTAKAERVYKIFDKANTGKVDRDEARSAIKLVLDERTQLFKTVRDRENIEKVLNRVLSTVFWVVMFVTILLVFGISFESLLIPFGTVFLGLSFVFGNSLKNVWESIIVIFINRPFEAGDRINIGHTHDLIIQHVWLLTTEAYSPDGRQFLIPNETLFNREITQMKRSKNISISLSFAVDFRTPKSAIEAFRKDIEEWLKKDEAPWDLDNWRAWVGDVIDLNKMNINLWIPLLGINWQSPGLYIVPRHSLWLAIQDICIRHNIRFYAPIQRVQLMKDSVLQVGGSHLDWAGSGQEGARMEEITGATVIDANGTKRLITKAHDNELIGEKDREDTTERSRLWREKEKDDGALSEVEGWMSAEEESENLDRGEVVLVENEEDETDDSSEDEYQQRRDGKPYRRRNAKRAKKKEKKVKRKSGSTSDLYSSSSSPSSALRKRLTLSGASESLQSLLTPGRKQPPRHTSSADGQLQRSSSKVEGRFEFGRSSSSFSGLTREEEGPSYEDGEHHHEETDEEEEEEHEKVKEKKGSRFFRRK
ncbi:hypothetical protein QOT17_022801 [Balamuthia mandrillaris]